MTVRLTKNGFVEEKARKNKKTKEWETKTEKLNKGLRLLGAWRVQIIIDEDVVMRDFFKTLEKMDDGLLTVIEMLTNSNWKPHLGSWRDPIEKVKDSQPLHAVEVYKYIDINNYSDLDNPEIECYPACHGLGSVWNTEGMENVPEDERASCNNYAIEFLQWNELKDLKLQLRPKMQFGEMVWKKGKKRKVISNGGNAKWNFSDRDLVKEKTVRRELKYTMSVGEFFDGLASELCFFGSPQSTKKQKDILNERIKDIEKK